MRGLLILVLAALVLPVPAVVAWDYLPARPVLRSCSSGRFYAKMIPGDTHRGYRDATGAVYAVGQDGDDLVWEWQSTYTSRFFVSNGGRYVVLVGGAGVDLFGSAALAFFAEGELVREYKRGELIEREDMLNIVGALVWDRQDLTRLDSGGVFRYVTWDGMEYRFRVSDGEILEQTSIFDTPEFQDKHVVPLHKR